jgi:trans-2,3-dihydro-3-hydroxyanthranilate isomerase
MIHMVNRDKTGRGCGMELSECSGFENCGAMPRGPSETVPGHVEIYQVDAFTDVVFGGNPAGVVPFARGLTADSMQKIAREMNLSETAFVVDLRRHGTGASREVVEHGSCVSPDFEVRFFTPVSEVDLCGHATIGTFWLLAELGLIGPKVAARAEKGSILGSDEEIRVYQGTGAGVLPVDLLWGCEGVPSRVMMTQNLPEVSFQLDGPELQELEQILGAPKGSVASSGKVKPQAVSTGLLDLIVPVTSLEALLSMRPDMACLSQFCQEKKVISVHCFSMNTMDSASTVHCRDFAPAVGIPEESATGTASGAAGAYLVLNRLVDIKEPVTRIICEQGHIMKRPSVIHVEIGVEGGNIVSVRVGGSAVTVMNGVMRVL